MTNLADILGVAFTVCCFSQQDVGELRDFGSLSNKWGFCIIAKGKQKPPDHSLVYQLGHYAYVRLWGDIVVSQYRRYLSARHPSKTGLLYLFYWAFP